MSIIKEKGIYFTPYRVSTITCNADIGENIDLSVIFNNIDINEKLEENNFIWIQYLKDDNEYTKGIYPKKRRKSKKNILKKNKFDNQMTVIYKYNINYMPNVKIFKNGNIQLTGIKDVKDTEFIVNEIIKIVKNIYKIDKKVFLNEDIPDICDNLKFSNFKIRMINTDFKIYTDETKEEKFNIRRKELHKLLISDKYNNKSSFQPAIYQGVKIEFFWGLNKSIQDGICNCEYHNIGKDNGTNHINCKKVTIAVFESGSILITGGITFEQVNSAYNYITNILKENKEQIRRPIFNPLMAV